MENEARDFAFYSKFVRLLINDLDTANDKVIALSWLKRIGEDKKISTELRTSYIKMLLYTVQESPLIGIFSQAPSDSESLQEMPEECNVDDAVDKLVELIQSSEEYKSNEQLQEDFPLYTPDISLEWQDVDSPSSDFYCYYCSSEDHVTNWLKGVCPMAPDVKDLEDDIAYSTSVSCLVEHHEPDNQKGQSDNTTEMKTTGAEPQLEDETAKPSTSSSNVIEKPKASTGAIPKVRTQKQTRKEKKKKQRMGGDNYDSEIEDSYYEVKKAVKYFQKGKVQEQQKRNEHWTPENLEKIKKSLNLDYVEYVMKHLQPMTKEHKPRNLEKSSDSRTRFDFDYGIENDYKKKEKEWKPENLENSSNGKKYNDFDHPVNEENIDFNKKEKGVPIYEFFQRSVPSSLFSTEYTSYSPPKSERTAETPDSPVCEDHFLCPPRRHRRHVRVPNFKRIKIPPYQRPRPQTPPDYAVGSVLDNLMKNLCLSSTSGNVDKSSEKLENLSDLSSTQEHEPIGTKNGANVYKKSEKKVIRRLASSPIAGSSSPRDEFGLPPLRKLSSLSKFDQYNQDSDKYPKLPLPFMVPEDQGMSVSLSPSTTNIEEQCGSKKSVDSVPKPPKKLVQSTTWFISTLDDSYGLPAPPKTPDPKPQCEGSSQNESDNRSSQSNDLPDPDPDHRSSFQSNDFPDKKSSEESAE